MSERGVFAVDRGIWEHDLFFDGEPFSRREAWLWIVSEAAWKPRTRRITGKVIELERGQVVASLRFIASKWGWSEPKVRRFLKALISDCMIDAKTDAGITVVTVCKYDEYQRVSLPSDASRKSDDDAVATQQRRNTEDIKHIEEASLVARDDWPDGHHELFWSAFPNKVGKPKALAKLNGCRKRGVVFADIMNGLQRYIRTKPPDRAWLNPETFLNQERWNDQPASIENGQPTFLNRSATSSPQQSGSAAIIAGVAAATERRARERNAAGQPGPIQRNVRPATGADLELFGEIDRGEPH